MTLAAGEVTLNSLTPKAFKRLEHLGHTLREKLRAVFAELEVPAQVTGFASLFGIHFTAEEVVDYRSMLRGDQAMKKAFFIGLLNEGMLLQVTCAGALNLLTTEEHVNDFVDATRRVTQRIR
jgi:glutamate-1-semialdehyde 2,1-aminomutase